MCLCGTGGQDFITKYLAFSDFGPHDCLCRYQSYLRRARTENFSDFTELGAFYKAGERLHSWHPRCRDVVQSPSPVLPTGLDYMGRQVVVYVGKLFPAPKFELSKVTH